MEQAIVVELIAHHVKEVMIKDASIRALDNHRIVSLVLDTSEFDAEIIRELGAIHLELKIGVTTRNAIKHCLPNES